MYKYIVKIISVNHIQKIMNPKETIFERQQISCNGCCMPRFNNQEKDQYFLVPSRVRVYSEPKDSKSKKIQIITARKGYSQGKETNHTNGSVSHQKLTFEAKKQQRPSPSSRVTINFGSKMTSQVSKSLKVNFNNNIKLSPAHQNKNNVQALSPCKIPPLSKKVETQANKLNIPNFLYISEISLVSEEFVSQGSAMNIANLISSSRQGNVAEAKNDEACRRIQNCEDKRNPIERMMNRKKYEQKVENRKKKLVL